MNHTLNHEDPGLSNLIFDTTILKSIVKIFIPFRLLIQHLINGSLSFIFCILTWYDLL